MAYNNNNLCFNFQKENKKNRQFLLKFTKDSYGQKKVERTSSLDRTDTPWKNIYD